MKKLSLLFVLLVSASLVFGQANGLVISNKASGGAIGTAAATVDVASLFNVNQTTASQTLTVPNLTNTTNGKTIHINNVGSASFTLLSKTIEPGTGILLRWTGSAWNISGVGNATGGGGGSGDIEGVTAGNGISGGGTTGTVTISADTSILATKNGLLLKVDKSGTKVLSDENYSTAEKSKLAGIATGATANDTDANLKNRANHTGQDQISDVSGLQSALDLKAPLASPALTGNPTAPTATPGTNSTQIATTAYVDAAAQTITTVGNIITEPCDALTSWTQTGAEFSASGGKFNITSSAGSLSFSSYIRHTVYGKSDLENTTITANLVVGTVNSTSWGVGIGYKSQRSTFPKSLAIDFLMDNTNKGKIAFHFNESTTGGVVSSSSISLSSGDSTTIKIRQVKDTYIVTWRNVTAAQEITASYTYALNNTTLNPTVVTNMPNAYNYTIYALGGGTHTIDNFTVNSDEKKYPAILFIGDSEIKGYNLTTISRRAVDLLGQAAQQNVCTLANGGNWIEDVNAAEALAFLPIKIVISSGINNLDGGDSDAAAMAKLATLVSSFTGAGYVLGTNLFVTTLRPYSGKDVTGYNALIRSTYSSSFIELYFPLWSGTGFSMNAAYAAADGLHLNEYGAQLEAGIYLNYFNLQTKQSLQYTNKQVFSDQQGRVAIGVNNIARYALDVSKAISNPSQIHLSSSTLDNGGYIHTNGTSNIEHGAGISWNGTNYTYKSTSYSLYVLDAGFHYFWGNTGVTSGNTVTTPNSLGNISPTGRWKIGDASTATARLHIVAGTATASTAPLKLTSGTNLTTPENGAFEYNGTNLFFTRTGATRENIITTGSVNTVSPTSPNRTITVVINGVTYYIAAKTTND